MDTRVVNLGAFVSIRTVLSLLQSLLPKKPNENAPPFCDFFTAVFFINYILG